MRCKEPCRGGTYVERMCAAAKENIAQILIASADLALSESRKKLIEREGWTVLVSRNKQHALALLHKESFDLLILCNSLSAKAAVEFTSVYRQKNPDGRILAIVQRGEPEVPFDAVLFSPVAPMDLIRTVDELLGGEGAVS